MVDMLSLTCDQPVAYHGRPRVTQAGRDPDLGVGAEGGPWHRTGPGGRTQLGRQDGHALRLEQAARREGVRAHRAHTKAHHLARAH